MTQLGQGQITAGTGRFFHQTLNALFDHLNLVRHGTSMQVLGFQFQVLKDLRHHDGHQ